MKMRLCAVLAIALIDGLWGCTNGPSGPASFAGLETITLHGQARYADGTPAGKRALQVRFLGNGSNLFPEGVHGCGKGDEHAQALQLVNLVTAGDGTFLVSAPIHSFVRATDETCTMSRRAAAHLTNLDVRVQTDADSVSCLAYCRSNAYDSCLADCVGEGQKFVWTASLTSRDVGSHVEVRLTELGPPLSPTSPPATDLPDLQVDVAAAASSLEISHEDFAADACELEDQCIAAPGRRTLIRFDGVIENLGLGDLVLGNPVDNPYFTYSACHGHYHLKDILTAELLDPATGAVLTNATGRVISRKQGFCIKDVDQIAGDTPGQYDCENQGLTSGWADVYTRDLSCQWLDVTDAPRGDYTLRITVNAARTFPESHYGNNSALIPVAVP